MLLKGFDPVVGDMPVTLILGSMPSVRSLELDEYYAHPRNVFWNIIADVYNIPRSLPYLQRLELLKHHHVALWDVIGQCHRKGSLDAKIEMKGGQLNDLVSFFRQNTALELVLLNGGKAGQLFKRNIVNSGLLPEKLDYQLMPSTSPAYAAMTYKKKLEIWGKALRSVSCYGC